MSDVVQLEIAGLVIRLHDLNEVLAELRSLYDAFQRRSDSFKSNRSNPHLCRAGCSHCCRSGAVFAVTLAETVFWCRSIEALSQTQREACREKAKQLLEQQHCVFPQIDGPTDIPGLRDEALFSARVSKLNATGPACPLLIDDLCSVYDGRPMLCRAYGFPVDAYSVQSDSVFVFRSLCQLYDGMELSDYVRARDLKNRLSTLSLRLGGGRDWKRFTSPEAILARLVHRKGNQ